MDFVGRPSLVSTRPVSQDNPGAEFVYEYYTTSGASVPITFFGSYMSTNNVEYLVYQDAIRQALVFTGSQDIATFEVQQSNVVSTEWSCITNIVALSNLVEIGKSRRFVADETYADLTNNAVAMSPEEFSTKVLYDLAHLPTNGWFSNGVGCVRRETAGGTVSTIGYDIRWGHRLTNNAILLNDIVTIGYGRTGYNLVHVRETSCRKVGVVSTGIACLVNFSGPDPSIEQHYLRVGSEIRPVWRIGRGDTGYVVVDCVTEEEITDVEL